MRRGCGSWTCPAQSRGDVRGNWQQPSAPTERSLRRWIWPLHSGAIRGTRDLLNWNWSWKKYCSVCEGEKSWGQSGQSGANFIVKLRHLHLCWLARPGKSPEQSGLNSDFILLWEVNRPRNLLKSTPTSTNLRSSLSNKKQYGRAFKHYKTWYTICQICYVIIPINSILTQLYCSFYTYKKEYTFPLMVLVILLSWNHISSIDLSHNISWLILK